MGHVILPTGSSVWVDELSGSVNLSELINDMKCEDYTISYRISIIVALGKLGKHANNATTFLKELSSNKEAIGNEKLLVEAAEQSLKKIDDGVVTRTDNHHHRSSTTYGGHSTTVKHEKKPEVQKVTFTELETTSGLHDGLKVYCKCNFCDKMTSVNSYYRRFSDQLAGTNRFFCNFCIRNDYYQRFNSNIMVLTYRGIIGYYYYAYYIIPKSSSMYMSDVQDYVELHIKAGLQNPLFKYDPETFCWFIDFSKVGKTRKKMPIEVVLNTLIEQLACFNLYENVKDCSPIKLYAKYKNAVTEFYQQRVRVNGDRVFAPTLWGCDIPTRCLAGQRAIPVDMLSGFVPSNMVESGYYHRNKMGKF